MASLLNPYAGGRTGGGDGGGGGGTPVGAVSAPGNPLTGVKRPAAGNPVGVPRALPSSRGRDVGPGAAIKAPKLRNGNNNNEQSNIAVPYSRVTPLEMLSGFCGRLSPGDCIFVDKYPPGFVNGANRSAHLNNATLGPSTMTRVVGVDGLNRLLVSAKPSGWVIGTNLLEVDDGAKVYDAAFNEDGEFALKTLERYRLDGIVKSNDEPGAFTSSGERDAAIFNVVIQGPQLVNNGYLYYDDSNSRARRGASALNNATGVPDKRTVETFARGSTEAGFHVGGVGPPGRTGSPWLGSSGYDFVAQFTGTYSMYPAQCFDRGVRSLDTLFLGLVSVKLEDEVARQVNGYQENKCYHYFQYMPFSSRAAWTIQAVADAEAALLKKGTDTKTARAEAESEVTRKLTAHASGTNRHRFDQNPFDAIRTSDLHSTIGAWRVGRVLDTKAMRYDSYAGGPSDTAYALMVDVGISWRNSFGKYDTESSTEKDKREADEADAYKTMSATEKNRMDARRITPVGASRMLRPPLSDLIGGEVGKATTKPSTCGDGGNAASADPTPATPPSGSAAPAAAPAAAPPVAPVAPVAPAGPAGPAATPAANAPPATGPAGPAGPATTPAVANAPPSTTTPAQAPPASATRVGAASAARKKSPAPTRKKTAMASAMEAVAVAPVAAVPAAAMGVSATPLIPSAGPAVPRSRTAAGAAGGSAVDEAFERAMQGTAATTTTGGAAGFSRLPDAPPAASPTPSTGSADGASGPKTFRRPR